MVSLSVKNMHATSLQKISKKLGTLNHNVKQVYVIRHKVQEIYKTIDTKKTKYAQVEAVINAHKNHLNDILKTYPCWSKEHSIAPIYMDSTMEPTHITHSQIATLMNTYYEISRREQELHDLNHEIQEYSSEYEYALMDISETHESILRNIRECEAEAKFFGIPYNFQRCYQAIHDTNPNQFSSI